MNKKYIDEAAWRSAHRLASCYDCGTTIPFDEVQFSQKNKEDKTMVPRCKECTIFWNYHLDKSKIENEVILQVENSLIVEE